MAVDSAYACPLFVKKENDFHLLDYRSRKDYEDRNETINNSTEMSNRPTNGMLYSGNLASKIRSEEIELAHKTKPLVATDTNSDEQEEEKTDAESND